VRILERKNKTLQTRIGLEVRRRRARLPVHRREAPENVPVRVLDQYQSGRVAVAAAMKFARAAAIAAAAP
jgi:hypothetical protein